MPTPLHLEHPAEAARAQEAHDPPRADVVTDLKLVRVERRGHDPDSTRDTTWEVGTPFQGFRTSEGAFPATPHRGGWIPRNPRACPAGDGADPLGGTTRGAVFNADNLRG
ncbi:hypothetical protein KH5H1_06710 [Corallococcus caeni]|uniref:Uncharacterized protein n=1 Tax=Corallococcus caeni TaxID=3082388 RepID=A0ABQ6QWG8_9BACT|nr:hypothetical protein KH5H1_06710 [Corallococcus sp. KH5-1]GMU08390.1 hypothetical protein ASNO1_46430 [Corallococcus sp. NO1]